MTSPPFEPRQVLLFSGHRVDAPGRAAPRLPAGLVPRAAAALDAGPPDLAITQAASGGDLLFAEACVARGVRVRVLLPVDETSFIADSVAGSAGPDDWPAHYTALKAALTEPVQVMPGALAAGASQADAFERGNAWLLESALAHGTSRVRFVCLWDGAPGDGAGGTAHMVREARRLGLPMTWIDTRALAAAPP
jgi:hypothetical protein